MSDLARELEVATDAAREAAAAIRARFGRDTKVRYKNPLEPVTEADMVADRILKERITTAFPGDAWLSEETPDKTARLKASRVWLVDPLDGTREFVHQRPEFCVSIGLVRNGQPVLGVIVNPISEDCWVAVEGQGATCNDEPIHVSDVASLAQARIAVSRSETDRGVLEPWADLRLEPAGGMANKMVLIASGRMDATFTVHVRHEWDIAAGVVIITEAGGRVTRLDGQPFTFNRPSPRFQGIAASNGKVQDELLAVIRDRRPSC